MSSPSLESLQKTFKGDLVFPSDPEYPKAITRWAINAQRNSKVVAFVKDTDDIVQAIKFAKDQKLPIAIRGGGHDTSGSSSAEGGLVIDLSRHLSGVKVDPERKVAIVGGGAIWETVDKTAIEHGLATVAGTINHTGVGGLLLGGGYGYLSASHGLVIDNLIQATVVTADGSILTASHTENPDLFWGIRGGGCNFGVCAEFVLQLHPQRRKIFAGRCMFAPPALESVVSTVKKWWDAGPSEKEVVYQVATRGPDGNPFIGILLIYNGSEEEGRSVFKPFFDLKPLVDTCQEIPYEQLNSLNNEMALPGAYRYHRAVHESTPRPEVVAQEFARMVPLSEGDVHIMVFHEYIPGKKISSVARDATAFHQRQPKGNVLIVMGWKDNHEKNNVYAREAAAELLSFATAAEKEQDNIGYGNYNGDERYTGSSGGQEVAKSKIHFGPNYARLQRLKKQYDPELLFNKWFVVVPA